MVEIHKIFKTGNSMVIALPPSTGVKKGDQMAIEGTRDEIVLRRVKL
jgi:antitoxin component of MazEF toxin-antitoxin module